MHCCIATVLLGYSIASHVHHQRSISNNITARVQNKPTNAQSRQFFLHSKYCKSATRCSHITNNAHDFAQITFKLWLQNAPCLKTSIYFLNNSFKNVPISIIFGSKSPKKFSIYPIIQLPTGRHTWKMSLLYLVNCRTRAFDRSCIASKWTVLKSQLQGHWNCRKLNAGIVTV